MSTLRAICVRKSCDLLVTGTWDMCHENPFSYMPISVVQDILSTLWPEGSKVSRVSMYHSRLLLMSGRLENFELPRAEDEEAYAILFRMLSRDCQNLRTLSLLCGYKFVPFLRQEKGNIDAQRALEELLQSCLKLEYLHSIIYFEPDALRKCISLRTLKLHVCVSESVIFYCRITSDLLKRLVRIENIYLCEIIRDRRQSDELRRETVSILDNCSQLTSLGAIDSLETLKELHDRDTRLLGTPRQFQMRVCYWEAQKDISRFEYCDMIRVAVLSCPLLEVLTIEVCYAGGLQHLKALKKLTSLYICFSKCKDDFEYEYYSLLNEIGHQLRHLFVENCFQNPLSLHVIAENSPLLRTLHLYGNFNTGEGVQPCVSLRNLERLKINIFNQESVIYLLSNCLHLKVLSLLCGQLDDSAWQAILRKNPFAELECAFFRDYCSAGGLLSESAWSRFVRSAMKLTKCYFACYSQIDKDAVKQSFSRLNPNVVCLSLEDSLNLDYRDIFNIDKLSSC